MHTSRYAVCILLLVTWADVSFAAQENIITTVAGNGQAAFGGDGGPASEASLNMPGSVAVDAKGNVYIADWQNERIRKINPAGIITTVAGNGRRGFSGDGGPAVDASLDLISIDAQAAGGIAVDDAGNLYIADTNNHRVRKVDLNGVITTVAGRDWIYPSGLALDPDGAIYIASPGNNAGGDALLKLNPDGTISTVACCFWRPVGVALSGTGNLYVADNQYGYDGMIFKVDTTVNVPLGGPDFSSTDTSWTNNPWSSPWSLAVDPSGDVVVAEVGGFVGKVLANNEAVSIVAGGGGEPYASNHRILSTYGLSGYSGDGGPADLSFLASPYGVAVDRAGNIYIADTGNNRIRMVSSAIPKLTVNSTYCTGNSWSLQVSGAAASSDIRLLGTSNGATWEIPRWGTTQADGSFAATGTFAEGTKGSHTLRLQIAGTFSRTVSFVVSDCRP